MLGAKPQIRAIEDAGPARRVAVMAVTAKPRAQQPHLGDFIRSAPATPTRNRFQPLTLGICKDIAAEVESAARSVPKYVSARLISNTCPPLAPIISDTFSSSGIRPLRPTRYLVTKIGFFLTAYRLYCEYTKRKESK